MNENDRKSALRFEARELPRFQECVDESDLQEGETYFRVYYLDEKMPIPELTPSKQRSRTQRSRASTPRLLPSRAAKAPTFVRMSKRWIRCWSVPCAVDLDRDLRGRQLLHLQL